MSEEPAPASGERVRSSRFARFKGILKGRRGRFPVLLLMIVVLAIAMIYSLITGMV